MSEFNRTLSSGFLGLLNEQGEWWKEIIEDKNLFIGIRKNDTAKKQEQISVYYKGRRLIKITYTEKTGCLAGYINPRYLFQELDGPSQRDCKVEFAGRNICASRKNRSPSEIKDFIDQLIDYPRFARPEDKMIYTILSNPENQVLDTEVAFYFGKKPGTGSEDLKIDLAVVINRQSGPILRFYEVKRASDNRLKRAYRDSKENEIEIQIKKYDAFLDFEKNPDRKKELIHSYTLMCENLRDIYCGVKDVPRGNLWKKINGIQLDVDPKARLIIIGDKRDQKQHKDWQSKVHGSKNLAKFVEAGQIKLYDSVEDVTDLVKENWP